MVTCRRWSLLLGLMLTLGAPAILRAEPPVVLYVPNSIETTPFGPAAADVVIAPSNFLPCYGGPIALCYYSGPEPHGKSQPDLSCDVTSDGKFANCRCVEIPYGPYWVDIHAILDTEVYKETIDVCGMGGSGCTAPNSAPVCGKINSNELFAGMAEPSPQTVSTFSLALNPIPDYAIGQTNCETALYAGCMTAPCVETGEFIEICDDSKGNDGGPGQSKKDKECILRPVNECACPTFNGPFQVGQDKAKCVVGKGQPPDNVWSAAYNPTAAVTAPTPSCFPDAPGDAGCPLLAKVPGSDPPEPIIPAAPPAGICDAVCGEYEFSVQGGIEVGFTCDATLCTADGDPDLVSFACSGLRDADTSAILLLETEVGCSCCASQICECEPNSQTNSEIFLLNEMQRQRFITPQCDLNGTLCGKLRQARGNRRIGVEQ